jgi:hypothetical protein
MTPSPNDLSRWLHIAARIHFFLQMAAYQAVPRRTIPSVPSAIAAADFSVTDLAKSIFAFKS